MRGNAATKDASRRTQHLTNRWYGVDAQKCSAVQARVDAKAHAEVTAMRPGPDVTDTEIRDDVRG